MPSANPLISELDHSIADLSSQISAIITRLRQLSWVDLQAHWQMCPVDVAADISVDMANQAQSWADWAIAPLNARQHIAWSRGKQVVWLGQRLVIPDEIKGYPTASLRLRLALTWWAHHAEVYINGQLVQTGDIFDCSTRLLLTPSAQPGEVIEIALRLLSPGHDEGALVQSSLVFESMCESASDLLPEPGFVADEMAVLQRYLTAFAPDQIPVLRDALDSIRWDVLPDRQAFDATLAEVRSQLHSFSPWLKQRQIKLLGHAHLDLAWLWPIHETWEAAERTFQSVLALQTEFPELIFCHSTPALYAWVEQHRPELFAAIREKIAAGTWEVVAGLWVEPEFNLVSGESIVRQILYGQRYVQERFGHINQIAWLPDSFGFCWQLPQLLKQGGVKYFVTQKLRWNDTTPFPHDVFEWRSPDGSAIVGVTAPPIGTDINPIKMADYACQWETNTGLQTSLWLPGVGDHGGGPTRDMLEVARRWQRSPFFPQLEFSTAVDFLHRLSQTLTLDPNPSKGDGHQDASPPLSSTFSAELKPSTSGLRSSRSGLELSGSELEPLTSGLQRSPSELEPSTSGLQRSPSELEPSGSNLESPAAAPRIPIWDDELYLEFHRGCYTSHADQKTWNRQCEILLYQAELYASLATLVKGTAYPKNDIEAAWKVVLFNQFHDILPGSSIPEVYAEVNLTWQQVQHTATTLRNQSLRAIAQCLIYPARPHPAAQPVVVFNSLNWGRSQLVEVPLPLGADAESVDWQIYDADGAMVPSQVSRLPALPTSPDQQPAATILFSAAVASVGYRLFWCCPVRSTAISIFAAAAASTVSPGWVLENQHLQVTIDSTTGDIARVVDRHNQRDVLRAPGNQLVAFTDQGQYWDAWNIDPEYEAHPLPAPHLVDIQWVEHGSLRSRIRVIRTLGASTVCQDYVLDDAAPLLKIFTEVDWRERQVLVKTAFPLTVEADMATHDIPFGHIQRPTRPEGDRARAKWEVPALQWADLSTPDYGVSLLSSHKHGVDVQPSQLRLTLLRGSIWPDPQADLGLHQFGYALYPHAGNPMQARTTHHAYEFNQPLIPLALPLPLEDADDQGGRSQPWLSHAGAFLNELAPSLVLSAFKQSEDDANQWIIRAYECAGMAIKCDRGDCFKGSVLESCLPANLDSDSINSNFADPKSFHPVTLLETATAPSTLASISDHQSVPAWSIYSMSVSLYTCVDLGSV